MNLLWLILGATMATCVGAQVLGELELGLPGWAFVPAAFLAGVATFAAFAAIVAAALLASTVTI